jgi:hypothetical protein
MMTQRKNCSTEVEHFNSGATAMKSSQVDITTGRQDAIQVYIGADKR